MTLLPVKTWNVRVVAYAVLRRFFKTCEPLQVRPSDLPVLPLLFPALKSLFAEHYEEMQEKTAKKLRQKALLSASTNSSEVKLQTSA
ncbi:hypothetical protein HPB52_025578 [Rhipicephalus sanguineus]|uniref:Uncharacterized protein n=1 Tax=Rhipicephalus sanguineus TaxID=34632 RepID=A0A9D4TCW1_RHISA|nr:hypothetical protein HPB52_024448 [Rhipicephalus sanguineus]KAH7985536.1 hypothetical protein HPB52_025578 [Rhipicephalus sanguineus]